MKQNQIIYEKPLLMFYGNGTGIYFQKRSNTIILSNSGNTWATWDEYGPVWYQITIYTMPKHIHMNC